MALDIMQNSSGNLVWDNGLTTGVMSADEYSYLVPVVSNRVSIAIEHPTGDIVGVYYVEGVDDPNDTPVAIENESGTAVQAAKTSGNSLIARLDLIDLACKFVRVFFDFTSGTTGPGATATVHQVKR